MSIPGWAIVGWAEHAIPVNAVEEKCRCGLRAGHKVGEEAHNLPLHNMTAYVCCRCFTSVVGDCAAYPYPEGRRL